MVGITKVVEVIKVADNTKVVNHPMVVTGEGHTRAEKAGPMNQFAGPTGHQLVANILSNHSLSLETLNMTKDDTLHLLSCL